MVVVTAGSASYRFEILAAIGGTIKRNVGNVDEVRILWIASHFAEVPAAAKYARIGAHQGPIFAGIIRAKEST